jgi:serine protease Do
MKHGFTITLSMLLLSAAAWAANGEPQDAKARSTPRPAVPPRPAAEAAAAYLADSSGSYLGVDVREIDADRMAALKLKEERGVEITEVDQDAPAGKFGLKVKDVILEFNGQRVDSTEQLRRMLRETPGGRTVTLGIWREGGPQQVKVTVAAKKEMAFKMIQIPKMKLKMDPDWAPDAIELPEMPPIPETPGVYSITITSSIRGTGLLVDNLTPQLAEFFGAKGGGVLVRSVEKGSPGESAGIRAGDVIVKVDSERIEDRGDLRRVISKKSGKVGVVVIREKKEISLSLDLPQRRRPPEDSRLRPGGPPQQLELDIDPDAAVDAARLAVAHARQATQIAMARVRESLDQARTEIREKLRLEMPHIQEQLRQEQQKLRDRMDRLREQMEHLRPESRSERL